MDPEDDEEVATFKKTIAPFTRESVSPLPESDDEVTKEERKKRRLKVLEEARKAKANSKRVTLGGLSHVSSRPASNKERLPVQPLETNFNHFLGGPAREQIQTQSLLHEMDQLCQSQRPGIEEVPITEDNEEYDDDKTQLPPNYMMSQPIL